MGNHALNGFLMQNVSSFMISGLKEIIQEALLDKEQNSCWKKMLVDIIIVIRNRKNSKFYKICCPSVRTTFIFIAAILNEELKYSIRMHQKMTGTLNPLGAYTH